MVRRYDGAPWIEHTESRLLRYQMGIAAWSKGLLGKFLQDPRRTRTACVEVTCSVGATTWAECGHPVIRLLVGGRIAVSLDAF